MIITHTMNIHGHCRVYLGVTGSLNAWIEPLDDNQRWSFHVKQGLSAYPIPAADMRQWATHLLLQLAELLAVAPGDLADVPFETIASLHTGNPDEHSRMPTPRRRSLETAFMAIAPGITRPTSDFTAPDYTAGRRR